MFPKGRGVQRELLPRCFYPKKFLPLSASGAQHSKPEEITANQLPESTKQAFSNYTSKFFITTNAAWRNFVNMKFSKWCKKKQFGIRRDSVILNFTEKHLLNCSILSDTLFMPDLLVLQKHISMKCCPWKQSRTGKSGDPCNSPGHICNIPRHVPTVLLPAPSSPLRKPPQTCSNGQK